MAKSWKAVERAIATRLGGRRVPVTGRQRGDVPDIDHPDLALEIKTRKQIPEWLEEAMQQAEACWADEASLIEASGALDKPRLPVAIVHEDFRGYGHSLVFMRLSDFESRFMINGRLR